MALTQEFEKMLAAAAAIKGSGRLASLHCAIGGPPCSGKTTQAREYAEALAERGVILGTFKFISCAERNNFADYDSVFKEAQRGAVIIDEVEKADSSSSLLHRAVQALASGECLVIFTGTAEGVKKLVGNDPALGNRIRFVMTEQSFTREECRAYEVRETTMLRRDVRVMKPIRFVKNP
jgi:nucleoside-triphosphatase THEP1